MNLGYLKDVNNYDGLWITVRLEKFTTEIKKV